MNFEEASLLAIRMDLVLNSGVSWRGVSSREAEPAPMEIGNVESQRYTRRRRFTEEQMDDIKNKRCFVCKEKGCRALNHDKKKNSNSNFVVKDIKVDEARNDSSEISNTDSEN